MTAGEIAGLIAAIAFVALVALAAVPLLKLGRVLEEVRLAVRDIGHESVPILTELQGTVRATNDELEKLSLRHRGRLQGQRERDRGEPERRPDDTLFSATLGGPLVKTAAFTLRRPQGHPRRRRHPQRARRRAEPMRKVFWFAVGAGVTIFVVVKARQIWQQATPQAIGQRVGRQRPGRGRLGARLHGAASSRHGRA